MGIMFAPDMLPLVLSGKKTQTRRKNKALDTWHRGDGWANVFRRNKNGRYDTLWKVGNTYAVQPGRGKKAVGRVRLTAIRLETFASISQADAVAEGFADPAGFHAKIRELYGDNFDLTAPCWCLTFALV